MPSRIFNSLHNSTTSSFLFPLQTLFHRKLPFDPFPPKNIFLFTFPPLYQHVTDRFHLPTFASFPPSLHLTIRLIPLSLHLTITPSHHHSISPSFHLTITPSRHHFTSPLLHSTIIHTYKYESYYSGINPVKFRDHQVNSTITSPHHSTLSLISPFSHVMLINLLQLPSIFLHYSSSYIFLISSLSLPYLYSFPLDRFASTSHHTALQPGLRAIMAV